MKIVMVAERLDRLGGVERHVQAVARCLAGWGHRVTIVTARPPAGPVTARIVLLPGIEAWQVWPWAADAADLFTKADCVVCHDFRPLLFWLLPLLLRKPNIRVVVTFHGHEGHWPVNPIHKELRRLAASVAGANLAVGSWIEAIYGTPSTAVTYGGCTTPSAVTPLPPEPSIAYVGRLEPDTDVMILIEALALLKREHGVRLPLHVCGEGALQGLMASFAAEHGLDVAFHGPQQDPANLVRACRFVFATGYLALLEGAAQGRVVFAAYSTPLKHAYLTSMPGLADICVAVTCSASQLAAAIRSTVEDPVLAERKAIAGVNWARGFTWSRVAKKYTELARLRRKPRHPTDGDWAGVRAWWEALVSEGVPNEGITWLARYLTGCGGSLALAVRARLMSHLGEVEKALGLLEKARRLPDSRHLSEPLLDLGDLLVAAGRYKDAIPPLELFVRSRPRHARGLYLLGVAMEKAGHPAEAYDLLQRVLALEPDHAFAMFHAGLACLAQGNPAKAVRLMEEAIQEAPRFADPYRELARLYMEAGEPAKAEVILRRLVEVAPEDPEARQVLRTIQASLEYAKPCPKSL